MNETEILLTNFVNFESESEKLWNWIKLDESIVLLNEILYCSWKKSCYDQVSAYHLAATTGMEWFIEENTCCP